MGRPGNPKEVFSILAPTWSGGGNELPTSLDSIPVSDSGLGLGVEIRLQKVQGVVPYYDFFMQGLDKARAFWVPVVFFSYRTELRNSIASDGILFQPKAFMLLPETLDRETETY